MSDKIYSELDPIFETMGLLYVSYNFDDIKKETSKGLSEFGLDGEQFYSQKLKVLDNYVETFIKNRVSGSEDALFYEEKDMSYFSILLALIIENKNLLVSFDQISDDDINAEIIDICKTIFENDIENESVETIDDIILFIEKVDLEISAKWELLRIMQHPKKHIAQLIHSINNNIDAYQKAISSIKKPLNKLLEDYNIAMNIHSDKRFYAIKDKLSQNSNIYPMMVFPVSQMIFEQQCYYGLLCEMVEKHETTSLQSRESLLLKLKALSDKSKLDIITSLKVSPKYNLEIAQQLGLTAATMSHHMNVLLNCGFVGVEKMDGKVYYHLRKDSLKELIEVLEKTIL